MNVRVAEISDINRMAEIFNKDLGYPDCSEEIVKRQFLKIDKNREQVFVVEENKIVCGVIHVEMYNVLYMDTLANILGLAVSIESRRKGYGKELLNKAELWAKEKGAIKVRINSSIARLDAHKFYEKQGYISNKDQKRFIKDIN